MHWKYPLHLSYRILLRQTLPHVRVLTSVRSMSRKPQIISSEELPVSEAKWVTLKRIKYSDQEGRERSWEVAERKTRGSTGIDAVAILALLQPKDKSPPATIIIEQFRPPVEKYVIELPAGLIDEGETPEETAIRELKEETGFKADGVIEASPLISFVYYELTQMTSPGMTSANMKLVILRVPVDNASAFEHLPKQFLEQGEFIVPRVIRLDKLQEEIQAYSQKGYVVDARLSHFAMGYDLSSRLSQGGIL